MMLFPHLQAHCLLSFWNIAYRWKSFSASEAFAIFAKSKTPAALIGERIGGDGIGFGPVKCILPNSGFASRFTQEMGLNSDGTCNFEYKTEPDIKVSAQIGSSYSNDKAIQTVLKLNKKFAIF
jgi:C-terminal processing protease CtpA/Prc